MTIHDDAEAIAALNLDSLPRHIIDKRVTTRKPARISSRK